MHRIFQKYIDLLSSAEYADAFAEAMAVTASELDLSCFAYLAMPRRAGEKPLVISTYPNNWVAHYVRSHYERLDPIITRSLNDTEPFQWGLDVPSRPIAPAQRKFFDEASEFGIRLGFTVPIHDEDGSVAALTFAADQRRPQFEKCIDLNAPVLQLMARCFHSHVRRKLVHELTMDGIRLSPREIECLDWAAKGKSAWETGRILGISHNTAAHYLRSARDKLGVRKVVQAAVRLTAAKRDGQD
ncbi:LuxR family transcriptional regulator [Bradyrhizobium sp. CCGUVB14]|uniref:LuxR family transcriptional regulator n=1 Tax=Bradyrhizobium sp. CCGUVB14 TaxID=2949628 RepID=UPI0020B22346|nr:LuxR family transcriptional regulator [Bradyrhizobium sp. CCGUVB14]MCP3441073.1 LuxR family transcriptional regulator [Bradyrhizobium sp. CCGUVB14]